MQAVCAQPPLTTVRAAGTALKPGMIIQGSSHRTARLPAGSAPRTQVVCHGGVHGASLPCKHACAHVHMHAAPMRAPLLRLTHNMCRIVARTSMNTQVAGQCR